MNILFLLSCLEPAGSETYCVALAKAWGPKHRVFWISDRLHYGQSYISLPISQKAVPGGILNTWKVKQFVETNKIDLIHSHSRRAHWVAAQVSALTKIPHVTTVHQPLPVHFFSRLFPCLGNHTIAIDEVVAEHLRQNFHIAPERMSLIRNGIEMQNRLGSDHTTGQTPRVLLLGRLTGGRWRAAQFVFDVLKRCGASLPKTQFLVAGRVPPEHALELEQTLRTLNAMIAPSTIEAVGFIPNLADYVAGCNVILAGGRSALESLVQEKLVIALGEGGIVGLVSPETLETCLRTNFGDHLTGLQFRPAVLEMTLRQALSPQADIKTLETWGRQQVKMHYSIDRVAKAVEDLYGLLADSHLPSHH